MSHIIINVILAFEQLYFDTVLNAEKKMLDNEENE